MKLFLYTLNDGDNVINKNLGVGLEIDIRLKAETDIISPNIILQSIADVDYQDFNYAHIPELKRFYFIDIIECVNSKLWRLELNCDVLESYKDDILASNARLKRNIRNGDYLNTTIDSSVIKNISIHKSDVVLNDTDSSIILTTVGV